MAAGGIVAFKFVVDFGRGIQRFFQVVGPDQRGWTIDSTASLWLVSYHFIITPLLITYPIILALSVLIPVISYRINSKQSIVERLREAE